MSFKRDFSQVHGERQLLKQEGRVMPGAEVHSEVSSR